MNALPVDFFSPNCRPESQALTFECSFLQFVHSELRIFWLRKSNYSNIELLVTKIGQFEQS